MTLSVIFTTYNSPDWLEKVLWGYHCQTFKDFEVLVADDGSTAETAELIDQMQKIVHFPIRHIWHEDQGFRKCEILNKAIVASQTDYLVFSDGDCIPRKDFLKTHILNRREGCFLSGGAIRLPMGLSRKINMKDILEQRAFDKKWLIRNGLKQSFFKNLKLTKNHFIAGEMNKITPTKPTWNGGNSSAWKKDILAVNGYNEQMRYGALDRELGTRLENLGLKGVQLRFVAICVHLDHSRGYKNKEDLERNNKIWKLTIKNKLVRTSHGIIKANDIPSIEN